MSISATGLILTRSREVIGWGTSGISTGYFTKSLSAARSSCGLKNLLLQEQRPAFLKPLAAFSALAFPRNSPTC
jgi:hypothetical protein